MGERNHFIYSYLKEKRRERERKKGRESLLLRYLQTTLQKLCFYSVKRFQDIIIKREGTNNASTQLYKTHSENESVCACVCEWAETVHVGQQSCSCFEEYLERSACESFLSAPQYPQRNQRNTPLYNQSKKRDLWFWVLTWFSTKCREAPAPNIW